MLNKAAFEQVEKKLLKVIDKQTEAQGAELAQLVNALMMVQSMQYNNSDTLSYGLCGFDEIVMDPK